MYCTYRSQTKSHNYKIKQIKNDIEEPGEGLIFLFIYSTRNYSMFYTGNNSVRSMNVSHKLTSRSGYHDRNKGFFHLPLQGRNKLRTYRPNIGEI